MLVDGGSASASEIVAGALHDRGRATLVGTKTFGKGTVQQWTQLEDDSGGFRLTIAKWLTPDKTWIHGKGIVPDVVVTAPPAKPGDDPVLDAGAQGAGRASEIPTGPTVRRRPPRPRADSDAARPGVDDARLHARRRSGRVDMNERR